MSRSHIIAPSRRQFINKSSRALALAFLGPYATDITLRKRPWRVALIGTGWYGKSDLFRLLQIANVEVVGLCDVDQHQLSEAGNLIRERMNTWIKPPLYRDYLLLLQREQPEIVLVGSPDHWHALQGIHAMEAGAHVYLQKPISVDVLEGEALLAAANKYNRIVQIGTQRRSTPHLIEAKKQIVDSGKLGKIGHVEMCCYYHMRANRNPPIQEIPAFFDYNKWAGPAPLRPFDGLPHRGWWRALMEYSNGIMGDMCVHMFDTVRWLLGLGWPTSITSSGGIYVQKESKANTTDTQSAIFTYDDLDCVWQHRSWGTPPDPEYPWAFFIYGEKGTLKGSVHQYEFIPNDGSTPIKKKVIYERDQFPEDLTEKDIELHTAPATRYHLLDFLKAIEENSQPVANLMEGYISTASCIIANNSMHLGRSLSYDPATKMIKDDPEATALLKRPYRQPWRHPFDIQ